MDPSNDPIMDPSNSSSDHSSSSSPPSALPQPLSSSPPDSNSIPYRVPNYPTNTPFAYHAVISLFRFVLAIFFNRIVIENPDLIPSNGTPTILLANHSNSLTDALIVMASVPRHARRMLRMTAKATHFRRNTFSSWLIEQAGSVPLQRVQDYGPDARVDNRLARQMLIDALSNQGDAICIFPEGISRYHPALAPLKTGAARIAADVLTHCQDKPTFELNMVACSITYLHRQNFRSDVLVSFHKPIILRPSPGLPLTSDDPTLRKHAIQALTDTLSENIRAGTLDSPSWLLIRAANIARTLYAPFGTKIGLGQHVRLTQKFIDALSHPSTPEDLVNDLLAYQNRLFSLGIKDDRVANNRLTKRRVIIRRLAVRLVGAVLLISICLPGLWLWMPTFLTTRHFANKQRRKGPAWDTYDEVTQTKILWGLVSGLTTYVILMIITAPIFLITMVGVPVLMWFTLRWLEDLVATLRAARSLYRMLMLGKVELNELRKTRLKLVDRVETLAIERCQLPCSSDELLVSLSRSSKNVEGGKRDGGEIVIKNGHLSRFGYFSVRRRRKKDYNEVLRLWDLVDM